MAGVSGSGADRDSESRSGKGAFHSTALCQDLPAMTDKELKGLPSVKCSLTLMPYSYKRL